MFFSTVLVLQNRKQCWMNNMKILFSIVLSNSKHSTNLFQHYLGNSKYKARKKNHFLMHYSMWKTITFRSGIAKITLSNSLIGNVHCVWCIHSILTKECYIWVIVKLVDVNLVGVSTITTKSEHGSLFIRNGDRCKSFRFLYSHPIR